VRKLHTESQRVRQTVGASAEVRQHMAFVGIMYLWIFALALFIDSPALVGMTIFFCSIVLYGEHYADEHI